MPYRFDPRTLPPAPKKPHAAGRAPGAAPALPPRDGAPGSAPGALRMPDAPASLGGLGDLPQAGAGPASALHVRAGQALPWRDRPSRSDGFVPLDVSQLRAPEATRGALEGSVRFPPGSRVVAQIGDEAVSGVIAGFDYKGRAVLDVAGERRIAPYEALVASGPLGQRASVLAALPSGAVVAPPARLQEALQASLDVVVNGTHSAREYADAFRERGYEIFVVGGGVRDAIRVLAENPNASQADLLAVLNDIDVVTTAPPPVARQICEALAPELDQGGVWSPRFCEQFGVVLAGGKKAGQKDSEGLDICAMKSEGARDDMVVHPDTGERAFPTTFGTDLMSDALARDFSCNALYYDPYQNAVVDPTLQGIADAEHGLLHPVAAPQAGAPVEPSLPARFWKFRLRGFRTDGESLAAMRGAAKQVFSTRTGKERWQLQNALGRTAPKDAATQEQVETWLTQLRAVMYEDRCADLFDRAIVRGVRKGVISEVLKRTTKGLARPASDAAGDESAASPSAAPIAAAPGGAAPGGAVPGGASDAAQAGGDA